MQPTLTKIEDVHDGYGLRSNDIVAGEHPSQFDEYVINQVVTRVKDMSPEDKPRERLMQLGPSELSVVELVAVVLGVGTNKEEVFKMAHRVVREYGEKSISTETNPRKMAEALNIPLTKACQIIAAFELGRRFFASQAGKAVYIRNASQAYEYLRTMAYSHKEQLKGLYLNSRYQIVHDELISVGSLTASIIHPREVFRPAIDHDAVAIIIAHNHPSGSLEPTAEDIAVTKQLKRAGKMLGIDLLDHLIITEVSYTRIEES